MFYSPIPISLCVAVVFPLLQVVHTAPQEIAARSSLNFQTASLCKSCLRISHTHTQSHDHGTDFTRIVWVATAMNYFFLQYSHSLHSDSAPFANSSWFVRDVRKCSFIKQILYWACWYLWPRGFRSVLIVEEGARLPCDDNTENDFYS